MAITLTTRQHIQRDLRTFDLGDLFREALGWDNLREAVIPIPCGNQTYMLHPLAEKRLVKVYVCDPDDRGNIPADSILRKIESELTKHAYQHIIIYVDAAKTRQVWQWVKRGQGRTQQHLNRYYKGQSGELLAQKLEKLEVSIAEELAINHAEMTDRTARAFDVERVTKRFYDRFKLEHEAFLTFIHGISSRADREWYASLMLSRLMFLYFIQRKGFLGTKTPGELDGDGSYLSHRLKSVRQQWGKDWFHSFYRAFLLRLFHEGLSKYDHPPEIKALLGNVPYLNGGLFDVHTLERAYSDINIPDEAFARLFDFFDSYDWHLDDRELRNDREINPDVLGYIFEKYINQKQMGAFYTREDITEYISKNTIIPYIFDATQQQCLLAFAADGPIWSLLRIDPDRYLYEATSKGCELPLPPEIEVGVPDVAQRGEWNRPARVEPGRRQADTPTNHEAAPSAVSRGVSLPAPFPSTTDLDAYALPTESWREVVARRTRYQEVKAKLASGQITSINDFVTYNLDIVAFAEDAIAYCEEADLLRAFYDSIRSVTVLDPTCGSGAFLFAALNILEQLYEACLERMQQMIAERDLLDAVLPAHKRQPHPELDYFRAILRDVDKHASRTYFIYKAIIVNNLYGVDIMEVATEICKLRLFLKLVSQVNSFKDIEPLPDIDFNIRVGNTLVGFASHEEAKRAFKGESVGKDVVQGKMIFDDRLESIEQNAQEVERVFDRFRQLQSERQTDSLEIAAHKQQMREKLAGLRNKLDGYLASEYGIDCDNIKSKEVYAEQFARWQQTHLPFHWWVEFYGIMQRGGFDVIVGNPPYVEYSKVRGEYSLRRYATEACGNLYAYTLERSLQLQHQQSRYGMIIPHSAFCTDRMEPLMNLCISSCARMWISTYCIRPAKLFVGVDQRLAIFVSEPGAGPATLYSTQYHRWQEEARPTLFTTLEYEDVTELQLKKSVPKLHSEIEKKIWKRLSPFKKLSLHFAQTGTPVFFHNAPRYWIRAMTFAPYFWNERAGEQISSHVKSLFIEREQDAKVIAAIMNSSLFYWWFIILSNCRDLTMREIEHFPSGLASMREQDKEQLAALCQRLMDDYRKHAVRKEAYYKATGKVIYDEFYPRYSKPIIDEIDAVLARHYGFSDAELDFIINYDIKYRMGQDTEGES